jgi:hypothetical protein
MINCQNRHTVTHHLFAMVSVVTVVMTVSLFLALVTVASEGILYSETLPAARRIPQASISANVDHRSRRM